jgi:hypothetical protein
MKKLVLSIILLTMISISCSKKQDAVKRDTYEYFKTHLTASMDYTDIKLVFGEPDDDIGSGIHIYVYILADATEIWIGYTDKIHYANHMDSNHQLLHVLI